MRVSHLAFAALICTASSPPTRAADFSHGIGVLGDSYSDEYQFYPPDRAAARNWVEILARTRGLNFGAFSLLNRAEPRNQGFAYNWARSEATTTDLIATGQHSGLAAQVARGEVKVAVIFVGGNDFINAIKSPRPLDALQHTLPQALANWRLAVDTIRQADPQVELFLGTIPDIRNLPELLDGIHSNTIPRQVVTAYSAAIDRYNAQIREYASGRARVTLLDLELTSRIANLISRDSILVCGRTLDRIHPSNDINHFFLADGRHPGALGQALMAQMMIEALNKRCNAGIKRLTAEEVLDATEAPSVAARGR